MSRNGFHPDLSVVPVHYFFAAGKANSCARILRAPVQALEDHKYPLQVLLIDADAVIGNRKEEFLFLFHRTDDDLILSIFFSEFYGIADEVLEKQFKLQRTSSYGRQI